MKSVLVFFVLCFVVSLTQAQPVALQAGDAPRAANIMIEADTANTLLVVGEAGAVFASAQVAVRNPYTLETVSATALGDGSFRAQIGGLAGMPLQVFAARSFSPAELAAGGVLSGAGTWIIPQIDRRAPVFGVGGKLAYGAGNWLASGRAERLDWQAGERFSLVLDVRMQMPAGGQDLPYRFAGTLALRPVFDAAGRQVSSPQSRAWSSHLTPEGLPILGAGDDALLFTTSRTERFTITEDGSLSFRLAFSADLPQELSAGWYEVLFAGQASVADSEAFDWYANRVFGTTGSGASGDSSVALPVLLRVGDAGEARVTLSLFDAVGQEDSGFAAAANLVEHTPAQIVRDPANSEIVWQLLDQGRSAAGLLLDAAVLRMRYRYPDASGECALPAERLMLDGERLLLRLPRDCPAPQAYGDYSLQVSGTLRDGAGREFVVNSTFAFTVAEPLQLVPSMLPGTIFATTDRATDFVQLSPPVPAAWQARSSLSAAPASGTANPHGQFRTGLELLPDANGVSVVDYAARYTDDDGRLWAGSLRAVYVRAGDQVAAGAGGLADYSRDSQAWFDTRVYPADAPNLAPVIQFPRFAGDVALIPDLASAGIRPALVNGDYQYLSVMRPGLNLRQFVSADMDGRLLADDTLLRQVGTGSAGLRPGDVLLLNGATTGDTLAGYSAAAAIISGDAARVAPAFSVPLLTVNNLPIPMIVLPTSMLAGQVLVRGENLQASGYLLPPVAADLTLTITQPDQRVIALTTQAGQFGYFAADALTLTQNGIYWVRPDAIYAGITSAGLLANPQRATLPGAEQIPIFVVENNEPVLESSRRGTTTVPVGQAFTINVRLPADWSGVQAYAVARTAQQVLEIASPGIFSNQTNYTFDPARAARLFPNLETRASSAADIDEITIVLAMTGTDPQGVFRTRTRVFTLRAGQLLTDSGEE